MLEVVTMKEIDAIFAVTDALGIAICHLNSSKLKGLK